MMRAAPDRTRVHDFARPPLTTVLRFLLLLPLAALCLAWHSPHDSLTAHAVSPGFAEDHTLFVAASRFKVLLRSTDGGLSFETVNAGLVTGNVSAIALSPSFPRDQTLWCLEDDRVYRSTDAGERWHPVPLDPAIVGARDLCLTADGAVLLASTGSGLWRRAADADAWTRVALPRSDTPGDGTPDTAPDDDAAPDDPPLVRFEHDRAGARVAVLSTGGRLFLSDDAGASFRLCRVPVWVRPTGAVFLGDGTRELVVGTEGKGVFRSDDGGDTWQPLHAGLDDMQVTDLDVTEPDAEGARHVYASTASAGVFRWTGAGAWRAHVLGLREQTPQTSVHYTGVVVPPGHAESGVLYLFGFEGLHVSVHAQAWRHLHTLPGSLVRNLALSPRFADDRSLWLSTYGRGVLASDDAGASYTRLDPGDFDYPDAVDATARGAVGFGRPGALPVTIDGGATWLERRARPRGFPRVLAFAPDFEADGTALLGVLLSGPGTGAGVFHTADHGANWAKVGPTKAYGFAYAGDWAESGRAWLASPEGLFESRDRGASWSLVESCPATHARNVAARFVDGRHELLTCGTGYENVGVYLSRDGGETWRDVSAGLESAQPVYVGFGADTHAFVATHDQGVFRSTGDFSRWERTGVGPRASFAFEVSPTFARDRTVVAGGYRGVWISEDAGDTWRLSLPEARG